jgi:colanic acid biosynthesis glycosyl transferase WcaI
VQDFEVDAAFELGLLRGGFMRRLVLAMEQRLLAGFDTVSTISQRMLARLDAKGVPPQRRALLPNGIDPNQIRPAPASLRMRSELGIAEGQLVCLFAGTMNRKQGIHLLVEAARRLQSRSDVVIVLSGNGEFRAALQTQAQGLANVRFLDLCPADRFNELLNLADIHLLPQLRGAADLVMPSKLSGMLASGRPVVAAAAAGTEIASVVQGCGLVIEPESDEAFAQAIAQLCDDAAARQRMGAAAREFARQRLNNTQLFDWLAHELAGTRGGIAPQALEEPLALQEA